MSTARSPGTRLLATGKSEQSSIQCAVQNQSGSPNENERSNENERTNEKCQCKALQCAPRAKALGKDGRPEGEVSQQEDVARRSSTLVVSVPTPAYGTVVVQ